MEQKEKNTYITVLLLWFFFGSTARGGVAPCISPKFTVPDWGIQLTTTTLYRSQLDPPWSGTMNLATALKREERVQSMSLYQLRWGRGGTKKTTAKKIGSIPLLCSLYDLQHNFV
jgi:hypothetical protein